MGHIIWSALDDWTTSVLVTDVGAAKHIKTVNKTVNITHSLCDIAYGAYHMKYVVHSLV